MYLISNIKFHAVHYYAVAPAKQLAKYEPMYNRGNSNKTSWYFKLQSSYYMTRILRKTLLSNTGGKEHVTGALRRVWGIRQSKSDVKGHVQVLCCGWHVHVSEQSSEKTSTEDDLYPTSPHITWGNNTTCPKLRPCSNMFFNPPSVCQPWKWKMVGWGGGVTNFGSLCLLSLSKHVPPSSSSKQHWDYYCVFLHAVTRIVHFSFLTLH